MDKAIDALLKAIGNNPLLIALFAIFLLFLHYGPAYIKAISDAVSQRRRDNVDLLEQEAELKSRILDLKNKEKNDA